MTENQSIKRPFEDSIDELEGIKAVLLDIEGTITSISFVKEKMFPYVTENIQQYLDTHFDQEEIKSVIGDLRSMVEEDKKTEMEGVIDIPSEDSSKEDIIKGVVDNVNWQMKLNRKTMALKKMQGIIWRDAFKTGKIQCEFFEDVIPALKSAITSERKVYVYSSGCVDTQKMLFTYSTSGDISHHITDFFDIETGCKTEKDSYLSIAKKIDLESKEIVFLTDVVEEAKAANEAGMKTVLMIREGNEKIEEDVLKDFRSANSFSEIFKMEIDGNLTKKVAVEENGSNEVQQTDEVVQN